MIGQTINNYILERKLGEGGMGAVYLARHNCIERVVAIKVLHKTLFTQTNIRNRFKNEANALIKLGHPNIVKIYDYIEQDDIACLIMEYIEGFTLDDYIMKVTGPLPAPKATRIICSVLDAVQYAHDKNIFHRDIKPGNIMVSKDGKTVKIMDFGIAKLTDASNLKTTHANAQLGTPFYMSPEQVKGIPYTAWSDIYSLGVTLFEMVTGKCPYQEITNLFELQSKIVNEPLPPTRKYYPDVTIKIQDAIKIATNKIPEQRFKSCNEFKSYLLEIEKPHPDPVQKQTPQKQTRHQQPILTQPKPAARKPRPIKSQQLFEEKKKSNSWVYLLVLLSILALGGITYSYLNQSNSHLHQSSVIPTTVAIKKSTKLSLITNLPDKSGDSAHTKISEAENKTDAQILSNSKQQQTFSKGNAVSVSKRMKRSIRMKDTSKTPQPTAFQKVKNDLMNYLEENLEEGNAFGGIQYDNINEININSVSNKVYDDVGENTSYDVDITIKGQNRRCHVIYISNSDKPKDVTLF